MWRCIRLTYPDHKIKRMVSLYIRNIVTNYRNFLCDDPAIKVMKMKVKIRVSNYFKYGLGSSKLIEKEPELSGKYNHILTDKIFAIF